MSIHKSLVERGRLTRHRNVFSRRERIALLINQGKWSENDSVFGLPKIRNIMQKIKGKVKAKKAETSSGAATTGSSGAGGSASLNPSAATSGKAATKEKLSAKGG